MSGKSKHKKFQWIVLMAAALCCLVGLAGCGEKEATFTITQPEESDSSPFPGTWTSRDNEVSIDRYLYDSGNSITILKDNEQEYWCYVGKWSYDEDSKTLDITRVKVYKYDDADSKWLTQENEQTENLTNVKMADDKDSFTCDEQLVNDTTYSFTYTRGSNTLEVPDMQGLSEYIVDVMK